MAQERVDGSDGAHNPKVHEGLVAVPVSGELDSGPPTLSSATSYERLHKPCVAAVLGNVLELGNYPVSSCSVRLHHIAIDLRKRPVGRRPVPSFPAPRAIPNPVVEGRPYGPPLIA